jgi:hypothetical protein
MDNLLSTTMQRIGLRRWKAPKGLLYRILRLRLVHPNNLQPAFVWPIELKIHKTILKINSSSHFLPFDYPVLPLLSVIVKSGRMAGIIESILVMDN